MSANLCGELGELLLGHFIYLLFPAFMGTFTNLFLEYCSFDLVPLLGQQYLSQHTQRTHHSGIGNVWRLRVL